jgi:hypothetical protein
VRDGGRRTRERAKDEDARTTTIDDGDVFGGYGERSDEVRVGVHDQRRTRRRNAKNRGAAGGDVRDDVEDADGEERTKRDGERDRGDF